MWRVNKQAGKLDTEAQVRVLEGLTQALSFAITHASAAGMIDQRAFRESSSAWDLSFAVKTVFVFLAAAAQRRHSC